jgi:hypothetical protein
MNARRWLWLAAVVVALFGSLWLAEAAAAKTASPLAVAGKLSPCADGTFAFDAEIRDLASGETLVRPSLRFADGSRASVKTEIPGRETLTLFVEADRARNTATIELARVDGSSVTPLSRFDVRLR